MVTKLETEFLFNVEWGDLDCLVIDLPPGTGDAQLTITQRVALDGGVIVTTPQEIALLDVRRGVAMFDEVKVPVIGGDRKHELPSVPQVWQPPRDFRAWRWRAPRDFIGRAVSRRNPDH